MNIRALLVTMCAALSLAACGETQTTSFQGWVEANQIFVAPDENGRIDKLAVREGDRIEKGALLAALEAELQQADVVAARATVENARIVHARAEKLLKTNAGTQKALDDANALLREAEAKLNSAQTRLARRTIQSPVSGVVQQIYFRAGELVVAGRPIVAILPPGNLKIRFYVAQALLPRIAIGDVATVSCDGCAPDLKAKISFIAQNAEFTPPVIYSEEERAKLVFLVEAIPEKPEVFRVGQPLSVTVAPRETKK